MDETSSNQYLDPILVALLIILRSNQSDLYNRIISGEASPENVMEFLASLPGGKTTWTRPINKKAIIYLGKV